MLLHGRSASLQGRHTSAQPKQHSLSLPGGNLRTLTGFCKQKQQLKGRQSLPKHTRNPLLPACTPSTQPANGEVPAGDPTDLRYIQHRNLTRHAERDAEVVEDTSMAVSMPLKMRSDCLASLRMHACRHVVLVIRMFLQVSTAA